MEELESKIVGILFSNTKTGFYILKTEKAEGKKIISVKGNFIGIPIKIGLRAKFVGKYENHEKYGMGFIAQSCEIIQEKNLAGIINYLVSHVPSIGPITANKLYSHFGEEILKILGDDISQIYSVPFLTKTQAKSIFDEWSVSSENRNTSIFLSNLGMSSNQIRSVITKFGVAGLKKKIEDDPYCLFSCNGVGFQTADSVARKLGVGQDDPKRIESIIKFSISEIQASEGHVFVKSNQINDFIQKKLFKRYPIDRFSFGDYLPSHIFYNSISSMVSKNELHLNDDSIYLKTPWIEESESVTNLVSKLKSAPRQFGSLDELILNFEKERKLTLSEDQKKAILKLNESRVLVISGFPGTGKTLLISAFVYIFQHLKLDYSLMSPTGIAAKRLSQVTGKPASTIHRAFGYKTDGEWEFNSLNKYKSDVIIIDEMSMVDSTIFHRLITSIDESTCLIMVGDADQLPSVGYGDVLRSLMRSNCVPKFSLNKIYRQDKKSDIVRISREILFGNDIKTSFDKSSEVLFIQRDEESVIDEIKTLSSVLKSKSLNFQVIAPVYDGELGVDNLNRSLRSILNDSYSDDASDSPVLKIGESEMRIGDRVMVVKNDYQRMIYNGDIGKIQNISFKEDEISVKIFDWFNHESILEKKSDKIFTFKIEEARSALKVSYATTTHKVQSQEYDYIILPMTKKYKIMLYKNLIYTAITRAKKKVFVIGDISAFSYGVSNDRDSNRNSNLNSLIDLQFLECK